MIDNNISQFAFLAAIAPVVAFWGQIKSGLGKIVSLIIKTDSVSADSYFINYIFSNSKEIKIGNEGYFPIYLYNKRKDEHRNYYYSTKKSYILLYKKFIPIIISGDNYSSKISYIRYFFNLERILKEVSNSQGTQEKRISYFSINDFFGTVGDCKKQENYNSNEMKLGVTDAPVNPRSEKWFFNENISAHLKILNLLTDDKENLTSYKEIDNKSKYFFTKTGEKLLNEIKTFFSLESFYSERGIPYRRGYGLYSRPGCGKTTLIVEIAKKLSVPIYVGDDPKTPML